jgi:hypothetical protein
MSCKRRADETFDEFKIRRKAEKEATENALKPQAVEPLSTPIRSSGGIVIISKSKEELPLEVMRRIALYHAYEPETVRACDVHALMQSLDMWTRRRQQLCRYELEFLIAIQKFMMKVESGIIKEKAKLYKEKGINWKLKHRLPEFYTPLVMKAAQDIIDKTQRDHPETI